MTALCFVCLTRDAGSQLLADILAVVRSGDQIVIVDDSGTSSALAKLREMQLAHDFPKGVTVTPIIIGNLTTVDVAAGIGFAAATTPRAILLGDQTRLTETFDAARDLATDGVTSGPSTTPDIFQKILPPSCAGPTILATLWAASQLAQVASPDGFTRNTPPTDDTISTQIETLLAAHPEAADWIKTHRDAWTGRCTPGARIVHALCTPKSAVFAPAIGGTKPRVFLAGPHANRCPLSYSALAPLWADDLGIVDSANAADVVVYAHPQDVENAAEIDVKSPANYVLFSEEPFWDSLFSPDPTASTVTLPMAHVGLRPMRQINHHTSEVYNFDSIPYYLLTHPRFIAAYQRLFKRNAAISPADWRVKFDARKVEAAFMAERRTEDFHDLQIPRGDITGLCAWRTRLAEKTTGDVQRLGASWQGGRTRFQIGDWHRDKLAQLDDQARLISAIENTHQPTYISEKLFDAFACAARPIYVASPQHLVKKLGLPAKSWVNLAGLESGEAAISLSNLAWDDVFFSTFAEAQNTLCILFHDTEKTAAEHRRLRNAVVLEIQRSA